MPVGQLSPHDRDWAPRIREELRGDVPRQLPIIGRSRDLLCAMAYRLAQHCVGGCHTPAARRALRIGTVSPCARRWSTADRSGTPGSRKPRRSGCVADTGAGAPLPIGSTGKAPGIPRRADRAAQSQSAARSGPPGDCPVDTARKIRRPADARCGRFQLREGPARAHDRRRAVAGRGGPAGPLDLPRPFLPTRP